jgi:hypothetical protein
MTIHRRVLETINREWAAKSKAQQFDVLSFVTKAIIEAWWVDHTRVSPN